MSKQVKSLLRKEITNRLGDARDVAVVSLVGIDGVTNNRLRGELRQKGIRVMVVKNAMARQAFGEMGLGGAEQLLDGACALAYGGESVVDVVRELLNRIKQIPQLSVRGALMEGTLFGPDRVEELSRFPTRTEALGNLARAITSPAGNLVSAMRGPASVLAGILKSIEEKREKEAPPAAAEAPAAEAAAAAPAPEAPVAQ